MHVFPVPPRRKGDYGLQVILMDDAMCECMAQNIMYVPQNIHAYIFIYQFVGKGSAVTSLSSGAGA